MLSPEMLRAWRLVFVPLAPASQIPLSSCTQKQLPESQTNMLYTYKHIDTVLNICSTRTLLAGCKSSDSEDPSRCQQEPTNRKVRSADWLALGCNRSRLTSVWRRTEPCHGTSPQQQPACLTCHQRVTAAGPSAIRSARRCQRMLYKIL